MIGLLMLLLAQVAGAPVAPEPAPIATMPEATPTATVPEAAPIAAVPVADPILAEQRGGFRLPNGIDVALSVQTQTAVNGAVQLRTVFQIDDGSPTFTIYAAKTGETVSVGTAAAGGQATQAAAPTISYDRASGIQVTPGIAPSSISVSAKPVTSEAIPAGLTEVAAGAVTDTGAITDTTRNGVRAVTLTGSDLSITHLAGNAFGSAIANSGNDRSIDTQTTVSINLSNAGPDVLGSSMFRVQDIALDAVAMRVH